MRKMDMNSSFPCFAALAGAAVLAVLSMVESTRSESTYRAIPFDGRVLGSFDAVKARIEHAGFDKVRDLAKDEFGIWRGLAMRNTALVHVAVDVRGIVGIKQFVDGLPHTPISMEDIEPRAPHDWLALVQ